jgi:8-oxo-dGTP diphosphatase
MGQQDQGVSKSQNRYRVIPRTLAFITNGSDVLLLRGGPQKRLWAGLYNGVGGHVEAGEDIYHALVREIKEETGLDVHDVRLRVVGNIDAGDPLTGVMIFVFTAKSNSRHCAPSEEGTLEWVPADRLPLDDVVEDLPLLLPRVLSMGPEDPPFFALYGYDEGDRLQVTFATAQ